MPGGYQGWGANACIRTAMVHGLCPPCYPSFYVLLSPWLSVWGSNRLRGKMGKEIRAEVKWENRKAGRKKPFKNVQLQSDDRLVEGN